MSRVAATLWLTVFLLLVHALFVLGCVQSPGDGEATEAQDQPLDAPVTITLSTPPAVARLNATASIAVGSVATVSGTAVQLSSTD
jgi:hypothetical protein